MHIRSFLYTLLLLVFSNQSFAIDFVTELGGIGHELVYDESRNQYFVSVPSLNEVVVVSADNMQVIDRLVVGSLPRGLDISHDRSKLFVALNGAGAVAVVDIETKTVNEIVLGVELGDSRTWDVVEAQPGRLFVSANPSSSGFAWIVQVNLTGAGHTANRVASNRIIRCAPTFEVSNDEAFLYVGECFSPNSLYKLDLGSQDAPIILEDNHGAVSGTTYLTERPDGTRIHLTSGQVLRTGSFVQAAQVNPGLTQYGTTPGIFYVAEFNNSLTTPTDVVIKAYDQDTYLVVDSWRLQCSIDRFDRFSDFHVFPNDAGFMILNQDTLCGSIDQFGGTDTDSDGIIDVADNCPADFNPGQSDSDNDGAGDICDPYPTNADNLQACLADINDKNALVSMLELSIAGLELENQTLTSDLGACTSELSGKDATIASLQNRIDNLESEIEDLRSKVDSDIDGVPDVSDQCPNTRRYARVDSNGCSKRQSASSKHGKKHHYFNFADFLSRFFNKAW